MKKFGEKLRALRKQRGMTTRELGPQLGVSYSFVASMERGEKIPNVAMVTKIADIFGVTVDQLVRDDETLV